MVAMSCRAWLSSQSWVPLSRALVASGRSSRNANWMTHGQEVDDDEDGDGDYLGTG